MWGFQNFKQAGVEDTPNFAAAAEAQNTANNRARMEKNQARSDALRGGLGLAKVYNTGMEGSTPIRDALGIPVPPEGGAEIVESVPSYVNPELAGSVAADTATDVALDGSVEAAAQAVEHQAATEAAKAMGAEAMMEQGVANAGEALAEKGAEAVATNTLGSAAAAAIPVIGQAKMAYDLGEFLDLWS